MAIKSSKSLKKISTLYAFLIIFCWLLVLSIFAPNGNGLRTDQSGNLRTTTIPYGPKAIVVGMPKSGTTSVHHYFTCNGFETTHYCCCGSNDTEFPCTNGLLMSIQLSENVNAGLPLLHGLKNQGTVHAQLDGELFDNEKEPYFLPQHYYLDQLHAAAPQATWILPLRSPDGWKKSVEKWLDMGDRLQKSYQYHNPNSALNDFLVDFYELHTETVRKACRRYQRKCVEIQVDGNAGKVLEDAFPGTHASCWGKHNAGPFFQIVPSP